jgi:hypothetical protein
VAVMIENEQQYLITKAQIKRFEETLVNFTNDVEDKRQDNPLLFEVQVSALESQLADLREELAEYEAQTTGPSDKRLILKSQTMNVAVKDNFMKVNSPGKLKTIEELIQNLTDKVTLPALISTSLISGGIIFLIYFSSIGYVPELEINSAIILLGTSVITGGFVYIFLSIFLTLPGITYGIWTKGISKKSLVANKSQQILQELLVDNKNNQIVGFIRLSIAPIILISALFVLVNDSIWFFYKVLFVLFSFLSEFMIFYTLCKKEITLRKIQVLVWLGCPVFLSNFLAISMTVIIIFSERIGNNSSSSSNENLLQIIAAFIIFVLIIGCNAIVSLDFDSSQIASKIIKYSLLSFMAFMLVTSQFGGFAKIPTRMVEIYGWRNVENASLTVDYEGCQTLKKIEVKITSEKCVKTKELYQIDSLQILSTIGKNYFLRYPKEIHITKKKNPAKEVAQPQKFVDFTFPASSVKSWSRK